MNCQFSGIKRAHGPEQKGYLPGRFIGEVTRTTYDIFSHAKENNISRINLQEMDYFNIDVGWTKTSRKLEDHSRCEHNKTMTLLNISYF